MNSLSHQIYNLSNFDKDENCIYIICNCFAGPDALERKTRDLIGQNRLGNISNRHMRMRFQHSLRKLMPSGEQKIPEWIRNLGDEGAKLAHALRSNRSPKVN